MKPIPNTRAARTIRAIAALGMVASAVLPTVVRAQGQPPAKLVDTQLVNMPVPAVIHQLKPHEVVERIISQRHDLLLSDAQFEELKALHKAVFEGRPIYESTGRSKPPFQRAVWIRTSEEALAQAFTTLTPQQQHQSLMLFEKEGRP